ncbi:MAG: hypothetical protein H0T46_36390 [Deltaproteobacteria bacterium]|nr:hypothetical protein [Deltaproteobacteria bacterium]
MGVALFVLWASSALSSPIFDGGPEVVRELVPATGVARAKSRTIYLNRHGATLRPGVNDARTNGSTIVTQPTTMAGWETTDQTWAATVACMRETWSRFDLAFTEVDPGSTPHMEALFGGSPTDIGRPLNIAGIAPMAVDCSIVENAIVFAFMDTLPNDAQLACEVMSQELGHAYGLDHVMLAGDPMSYLPFTGKKTFQETAAACGEKTARPCGHGATSCRAAQSSVHILVERIGAAGVDDDDGTVEPGDPASGDEPMPFGCSAGGTPGVGIALGLLALRRRRR